MKTNNELKKYDPEIIYVFGLLAIEEKRQEKNIYHCFGETKKYKEISQLIRDLNKVHKSIFLAYYN